MGAFAKLTARLANRVGFFAAAVAFLVSSAVLLSLRPFAVREIEEHLTQESAAIVESFAEFTMGYFYWQDNLIHMQTQQQFLNSNPNLLYSYIVTKENGIILGTRGIDSADIGHAKQTWEPEVGGFGQKRRETFLASRSLVQQFPSRIEEGQKIVLVSIPMGCQGEVVDFCGELRVALVLVSHLPLLHRFSLAVFLTLILVSCFVGLFVLLVTRTLVQPVRSLTFDLLQLAENGQNGEQSASKFASNASDSEEVQRLKVSINKFSEHIVESSTARAVAQVTAMLAHDVRKPFSMLGVILDSLSQEKDPDAVMQMIKQATPEVKRAIASVSSMVQDVMQMGAKTQVNTSLQSLTQVLLESLSDICRIYPEAEVEFDFDLQHTSMLELDKEKMKRVLTNLIANAFQAMNLKGKMLFRSSAVGNSVRLEITNFGSYISPEVLGKLFEPFFTANKPGGTGLGLAIVKKYVNAHNASIECRSEKNSASPSGCVSFFINFQNVQAFEDPAQNHQDTLPKHSVELSSQMGSSQSERGAAVPSSQSPSHELDLEYIDEVLTNTVFVILAVDDEAIYRNGIRDLIAKMGLQKKHLKLLEAASVAEALELLSQNTVDLVVQDIDLGDKTLNGFECIRLMRSKGYEGHICIHSNRFFFDTGSALLQRDADAVLPKPMNKQQLAKVIRAVLEKRLLNESSAAEASLESGQRKVLELLAAQGSEAAAVLEAEPAKKLRLWVIDDSILFRLAWKQALQNETELRVFSGATELRQHMEENSEAAQNVDLVFTDWDLGSSGETGKDVVEVLRNSGYLGKIFLWSNMPIIPDSVTAEIQHAFEKEVPSLQTLFEILK